MSSTTEPGYAERVELLSYEDVADAELSPERDGDDG